MSHRVWAPIVFAQQICTPLCFHSIIVADVAAFGATFGAAFAS